MPDATVPVRQGEAVDADALQRWLSVAAPDVVPAGSTLAVRQYPAGFSNLTYHLEVSRTRDASVPGSLVLRRPPRGVKAGIAHDMGREHTILSALYPVGLPVPRPSRRSRACTTRRCRTNRSGPWRAPAAMWSAR